MLVNGLNPLYGSHRHRCETDTCGVAWEAAVETCVCVAALGAVAGDSDAYSYINAKSRLSLREDDARQLVLDVLTALNYMHNQVWGEGGAKGEEGGNMRRGRDSWLEVLAAKLDSLTARQ